MNDLQPEMTLPWLKIPDELGPWPPRADRGADAAVTGESLNISLDESARHVGKRALDILGAAAGIVLLGPAMLLIAALIRLGSRGPVLFRQPRLGLGGRP